MNYVEAIEYLNSLDVIGSVLGLDSIKILMGRLGNPQKKLQFIHVAGTNGKGSVSSLVCSTLNEAGYITGQFSSPAVKCPLEIIRVEDGNISKEHYAKIITKIKDTIKDMLKDEYTQPTRFEIETAAALVYFYEMECEIIVMECGLGGLLDATNVIENTLCAVITSISLDHIMHLGNTLEEITKSKIGIIKEGCEVITISSNQEVMPLIKQRTLETHSNLTIAQTNSIKNLRSSRSSKSLKFNYKNYPDLKIRLLGNYQKYNAILALECILALQKKMYSITPEDIYQGFEAARWPGRFEVLGNRPDFIIDGAHNDDASLKLAESLRSFYPEGKLTFIIGVFSDKDYNKILKNTINLADKIYTIQAPDNQRALPAEELARYIKFNFKKHAIAFSSIEDAVKQALIETEPENAIIVFGSLAHLNFVDTAYKKLQKNIPQKK